MTTATLPDMKSSLKSAVKPIGYYMSRPYRLFREYDRTNFRPDFMAGLTVAVILLPQAIAFAIIAELPPAMGLYAAIVAGIVGALWGSSNEMHNGPTNAISLLILSTLSVIAIPGSPEYIVAAGMLALMVGVFQLIMGLGRLGALVNFVSHSVIVGFATGAGVLIGIKQIKPLLGLNYAADDILQTITGAVVYAPDTHVPTTAIGIGTIILIVVLGRINPKLPSALISMILSAVAVFLLSLNNAGVDVIGELPSGLPPLADLPLTDFALIRELIMGTIAVGAIGLVNNIAIARSLSAQTKQRLDNNQEFVGQGMANLFSGLFSGFAVAGSFSRTAVNFRAGAKTPISAILSSLMLLIALFFMGPFARYLPRSALAGVLIVTAVRMIDVPEIKRILRGAPGDAAIMVVTFFGTLFLNLETAVFLGITLSFALYVMRTSTPKVHAVLPDESFRHFYYQPDRDSCPQIAIIEILGGLYFGAVSHIEEFINDYTQEHPDHRFLLLRMHNVNHCDFSGIHMLENIVQGYRARGGDVFLVRVNPRVRHLMQTTEFEAYLGSANFQNEDGVISNLFNHYLDPAICIYECPYRVFKECQNLPKRSDLIGISMPQTDETIAIKTIQAQALWDQLHASDKTKMPIVVDVREPREFRQGHIAEAHSRPLSRLLVERSGIDRQSRLIFVCRSGRRSRRTAQIAQTRGYENVAILEGGMLAWQAAGLLTAVSLFEKDTPINQPDNPQKNDPLSKETVL